MLAREAVVSCLDAQPRMYACVPSLSLSLLLSLSLSLSRWVDDAKEPVFCHLDAGVNVCACLFAPYPGVGGKESHDEEETSQRSDEMLVFPTNGARPKHALRQELHLLFNN